MDTTGKWADTLDRAHARLNGILDGCDIRVSDITGDRHGIDSFDDAVAVLEYVLMHVPTSEEKAIAILAASEALNAVDELGCDVDPAGAESV